jgi:menaquinone-dependent protoporphyrinogen oxidase
MKVLIAYASKYGCTEKAALKLKELIENSTAINLTKGEKVNVNEYDCVLLGGSIYAGKILKQVTDFVNGNLDKLLTRKVGLFLCCGNKDLFEQQVKDSFPEKLVQKAETLGYFGYIYDFSKMNFLLKMIVKKIAKVTESEDCLDVKAIEAFAKKFAG